MRINSMKFKGLSKRIFISFSILIFMILVFQQIATYYIVNITVRNINNNYIAVGLKQKNEKLNNFLKEIDLFFKAIISNRYIQDMLAEDKDNSTNLSKISPEIGFALSNNIEGIFLISNNGNVYNEADSELGEYINSNISQIRQEIASSSGEMLFLKSRFISYGSSKHGDYFFLVARKIRSIDSFEDVGVMVVAIREAELWNNILMDGDLGDYYVVTKTGDIISCRDKELVGKNISGRLGNIKDAVNNGSHLTNGLIINSYPNSLTNWDLLNVVSIDELNANYLYIQRFILVIGVVAIIIAVYISIIISRKIARPIRDMIYSMKKVMAGNLDVQADVALTKDSTDELIELSGVFNQMTRELQYLIEKVYHESLREKEAELRALKAQINPHFLYNTLDTIYWMLIEKSEYEVAELIVKLSEILRYSIKKGSINVAVREEIQQVENYLFIQKARFEENLEYEMRIDETMLNYEMLSFLLQPFVENSINHGIMSSKGTGTVKIKGFFAGNSLVFEIIDDGIGMTKEQIEGLFAKKEAESSGHGGIGILNVHERIKYYYGEDYGVSIESRKGHGTTITVKIPVAKSGVVGYEA